MLDDVQGMFAQEMIARKMFAHKTFAQVWQEKACLLRPYQQRPPRGGLTQHGPHQQRALHQLSQHVQAYLRPGGGAQRVEVEADKLENMSSSYCFKRVSRAESKRFQHTLKHRAPTVMV